MSDNWYARRLARFREEQPLRPIPQPQPQQLRPQQPQPQQQEFIRFQQQEPQPQQQEPINIHNLWGAMQQWRGGKAHRVDSEPCPECGSNNYYSRTGGEVRRGPPPAPHCFSCGYNGMYAQGLPSSWQPS